MRYLGSKRRIAKEILPIILKDRKPGQHYAEPFVGGCNTLELVEGPRSGNDMHFELIELYKALQNGWTPPELVTEEDYRHFKNGGGHAHERGYAGLMLSFGAKWFSGFARNKKGAGLNKEAKEENEKVVSRRGFNNVAQTAAKIKDADFHNTSYDEMPIPENSIIYCDPPYALTMHYKNKIDHPKFWDWCREKAKEGHQVFVSGYCAPPDFKCVWSKDVKTTVNAGAVKNATEKLFTI